MPARCWGRWIPPNDRAKCNHAGVAGLADARASADDHVDPGDRRGLAAGGVNFRHYPLLPAADYLLADPRNSGSNLTAYAARCALARWFAGRLRRSDDFRAGV